MTPSPAFCLVRCQRVHLTSAGCAHTHSRSYQAVTQKNPADGGVTVLTAGGGEGASIAKMYILHLQGRSPDPYAAGRRKLTPEDSSGITQAGKFSLSSLVMPYVSLASKHGQRSIQGNECPTGHIYRNSKHFY